MWRWRPYVYHQMSERGDVWQWKVLVCLNSGMWSSALSFSSYLIIRALSFRNWSDPLAPPLTCSLVEIVNLIQQQWNTCLNPVSISLLGKQQHGYVFILRSRVNLARVDLQVWVAISRFFMFSWWVWRHSSKLTWQTDSCLASSGIRTLGN